LKNVIEDEKFVVEETGKDTCKFCKGDHYKEYAALEILNKALARMLYLKEYQAMFGPKNQHNK
jgi:hypothetical protein